MRALAILFMLFAGNALATSAGRDIDPSRLGFANTAAFRSTIKRVEVQSPGSASDDWMEPQRAQSSISSKVRIAMWLAAPLELYETPVSGRALNPRRRR